MTLKIAEINKKLFISTNDVADGIELLETMKETIQILQDPTSTSVDSQRQNLISINKCMNAFHDQYYQALEAISNYEMQYEKAMKVLNEIHADDSKTLYEKGIIVCSYFSIPKIEHLEKYLKINKNEAIELFNELEFTGALKDEEE